MKRIAAFGVIALSFTALTTTSASAVHERGDFTVGMNGSNEVGTEGDKDGSGQVTIALFDAVDNPSVVFPNEHYLCYELTVRNVEEATGLHIHEVSGAETNPRKDTGPVVVDLLADSQEADGQTCVAVDEVTFDGILADPGEYYVNYHTASHPAGAIRGQLHAFN